MAARHPSRPSTEMAKRAQELYNLKNKAMLYYRDNDVPHKMEDILNSTFYDNPNDVYGHLASYFEGFSLPPVVTKVEACEGCDSKGQPAVTTEVFCMIKNFEHLQATLTGANVSRVPDYCKPEEKEEEDKAREEEVGAGVRLIADVLAPRLADLQPDQQDKVDSVIDAEMEGVRAREAEARQQQQEAGEGAADDPPANPDKPSSGKRTGKSPAKGKGGKTPAVVIVPEDPPEVLPQGFSAASVCSSAVCAAGAASKKLQPFQHIASLFQSEGGEELPTPLPVVTILQSGRALHGKLQCIKDLMIFPRRDMPVAEAVKHMTAIYNQVGNTLMAKSTVAARRSAGKKQQGANPTPVMARLATDVGALCPALDRPEQALDMLQDAMTALGLTPGQDFFFAINCAAREIFDYEKGKYEVVAGGGKSFEDTAEMWADLVSRYPIKVLIDPLRKQEKDQWMTLCERVSEQCLVLGDSALPRAEVLGQQESEVFREDWTTSGAVLRLEGLNTVSHVAAAARTLRTGGKAVMLSASVADSPDTFIVDLAVGIGADFLHVGGAGRGERVAKLQRLSQIERWLSRAERLGERRELAYPKIEKPDAPPEDEDADAKEEQKDAKPKK